MTREGSGEAGHVQQEKVPEKVWEALVQSQVRFNRVPGKVPEKVPEKVPGSLVQGQVKFNGFRRRLQKPSQVRFIELTETQLRCFQRLASQHASERSVIKIKRCGCWGYHRSLLCGIHMDYVWNMYRYIMIYIYIYVEYVWNVIWNIWGFSLLWNTHGICMEYVCVYMYGICKECYIWYIWGFSLLYGICMEYRVSYLYMGFVTFYVEYTWNMYGICVCIYIYMEYAWNGIYGIYVVSHFLCGIYMEYVYIYMWNMYGMLNMDYIGFLTFI